MDKQAVRVRDVLVLARGLISKPERWTKGSYVRRGVCWCAVGALIEARRQLGYSDWLVDVARGQLPRHSAAHCLEGWNDAPERTHAEVIAAFDKAIEALS